MALRDMMAFWSRRAAVRARTPARRTQAVNGYKGVHMTMKKSLVHFGG